MRCFVYAVVRQAVKEAASKEKAAKAMPEEAAPGIIELDLGVQDDFGCPCTVSLVQLMKWEVSTDLHPTLMDIMFSAHLPHLASCSTC